MDKKAGYAQPIVDLFSTVIIILILVIFFTLFKLHTDNIEVKITGDMQSIDSDIMLLNYLRMPVDFNGEQMTMGSLLDRMDEAEDVIKAQTYRYIEQVHKNTGCAIVIDVLGEKSLEMHDIIAASSPSCREDLPYKAEQIVPTSKGNIRVRLYGKLGFAWDEIAI